MDVFTIVQFFLLYEVQAGKEPEASNLIACRDETGI